MKSRNSDHAIAVATKAVLAGAGVLLGILFLKELPNLVRYVKMERM